jgi:hypothetical protein
MAPGDSALKQKQRQTVSCSAPRSALKLDLDGICPSIIERLTAMNRHHRSFRSPRFSNTFSSPSSGENEPETQGREPSASFCAARSRSLGQKWLRRPQIYSADVPVRLEHAVRAKSAEFWLRLSEPLEALAEIENIPHPARRKGWVHRLHEAAVRAARDSEASAVSFP